MGIFSKSKADDLPDDLNGLLNALGEQRSRIESAERIARLRPGMLESAVAARQGVTYADASGPTLVKATLNAEDARKLARSGIAGFRSEIKAVTDGMEKRLQEKAQANMPEMVGALLAIMAGTEAKRADLRESAGYFLIENLGAKAESVVVSALVDADANIRFQAAHVLRFFHSELAVDCLIVALKDPDGDVRAMVTRALALQKDKRAVPALLEVAANDDTPGIRQQAKAAADALQKI